jgi:hypothetical protein
MDQADVSRLESRADFDDCQVATLRRYVEALGGSLELVARFGDKRISIAGSEAHATKPANEVAVSRRRSESERSKRRGDRR